MPKLKSPEALGSTKVFNEAKDAGVEMHFGSLETTWSIWSVIHGAMVACGATDVAKNVAKASGSLLRKETGQDKVHVVVTETTIRSNLSLAAVEKAAPLDNIVNTLVSTLFNLVVLDCGNHPA